MRSRGGSFLSFTPFQVEMKITYRPLVATAFLVFLFTFATEASGQMAAIAAIDEPEAAIGGSAAEAGGGRQVSSKTGKSAAGSKKPSSTKTTTPKPKPKPKPIATYSGIVLGDKYTFLNNEVISAEKPYYTRAAKARGAKGLVQVEVLVSTDGSVLSAKARTGNKELWPEAERAAYASTFNRPTSNGRPARAIGFLVYRFGPAEGEE